MSLTSSAVPIRDLQLMDLQSLKATKKPLPEQALLPLPDTVTF